MGFFHSNGSSAESITKVAKKTQIKVRHEVQRMTGVAVFAVGVMTTVHGCIIYLS